MASNEEMQDVISDYGNDYLVIDESTLEKIINFYAEKHYGSTATQIETKDNGEIVVQLEPL